MSKKVISASGAGASSGNLSIESGDAKVAIQIETAAATFSIKVQGRINSSASYVDLVTITEADAKLQKVERYPEMKVVIDAIALGGTADVYLRA